MAFEQVTENSLFMFTAYPDNAAVIRDFYHKDKHYKNHIKQAVAFLQRFNRMPGAFKSFGLKEELWGEGKTRLLYLGTNDMTANVARAAYFAGQLSVKMGI